MFLWWLNLNFIVTGHQGHHPYDIVQEIKTYWTKQRVVTVNYRVNVFNAVKYLNNERELLMIPGPTIVSPRVLRALVKPVLSHVSNEFVNGYAEALKLQKKLFGTNGIPFLLAGSGTLGMEAAISNLMEKGDKVLCVENGYFGEKWEDIVEAHGGIVERLRFKWGDSYC